MITADEVRRRLDYDPATGELTWREAPARGSGVVIGARAGTKTHQGYISIVLNDRPYSAHRLVWLHVYGEWPKQGLDHRNGDRADNRIDNLREANCAINSENRIGLGYRKARSGRWTAQIGINGTALYLGTFDTPEAAQAVYLEAKRKHHAEAIAGRWK